MTGPGRLTPGLSTTLPRGWPLPVKQGGHFRRNGVSISREIRSGADLFRLGARQDVARGASVDHVPLHAHLGVLDEPGQCPVRHPEPPGYPAGQLPLGSRASSPGVKPLCDLERPRPAVRPVEKSDETLAKAVRNPSDTSESRHKPIRPLAEETVRMIAVVEFREGRSHAGAIDATGAARARQAAIAVTTARSSDADRGWCPRRCAHRRATPAGAGELGSSEVDPDAGQNRQTFETQAKTIRRSDPHPGGHADLDRWPPSTGMTAPCT